MAHQDNMENLASKEMKEHEEKRGRKGLLVSMVRRYIHENSLIIIKMSFRGTKVILDLLALEGQRELKAVEGTRVHRGQRVAWESRDMMVRQGTKDNQGLQGPRVIKVSEVQLAYLDNLDLGETLGQQGPKARRGSMDTLLVTLALLAALVPLDQLDHPHQYGVPGKRGGVGKRGIPGPKGIHGGNGMIGLPGPKGDTGNRGEKGAKGEHGTKGSMGSMGMMGPSGSAGAQGHPGAVGPSGLPGLQGIQGLKVKCITMKPKGESAQPGRKGKKGAPGKPGDPGPAGVRGNMGEAGVKGKPGAKGEQHHPGPRGPRGIPGFRGENGNPGGSGLKGLPGDTGTLGPTGPPGLKGNPGVPGQKGQRGQKGKAGELGPQGLPGQQGTAGLPRFFLASSTACVSLQGLKGVQGERGPKGVQGHPGPPRPKSLSRRWSGHGDHFDWPLGTKEDPATTCYELGLTHPQLNDGYFYIDPNQGCPCDAVQVFCNFTAGGTTCIRPLQSQIRFHWEQGQKTRVQWLGQQHGGSLLEYAGLGVVQLRFMRFHSHTCSQRMTISCNGSQSRVGKTDSAQWLVHLTGDSGNEISSHFTSVSRRECEVEVDVHTQVDMELLPVRDLGVEISSGSPFFQEVAVVLGPLCFL
ncbi:Collagen alpha-2(XI) chain [Takifugu flavidus]|uniref:Collagen alpha-2(XI) chain n=1 Tax=Takifugu flavidus TaxID=433684 RepID=A0A5C6MSI6_9TELE|nr:Collagen alpha-2(XI) chain [Takifugu flavidus]